MPTNYAGSDVSYPANVPLPNDGEPAAAAFLNPAWQRLADRTAFLHSLLVTRERTAEVSYAVDHTLTVDEQLVRMTASKRVTLPDPALAVGRVFRIRLDSAVVGRVLPHAAETINGAAGGFPMSIKGGVYHFLSPDGVNWIADAAVGFPRAREGFSRDAMVCFYASSAGGGAGITSEVYGAGFTRLTDSTAMGYAPVEQNGFDIATVGGSWTFHDDGWITIVTGGGGGNIDLRELVIRDVEDPAYDGTTLRAAGVFTGVTG